MKIEKIKKLKNFGLNKNEAKVYYSLLSTGGNFISKISKQTDIKRSTLYLILEKLSEKSFVKIVKKDKRKIYIAETPEKIFERANNKLDQIRSMVPQLAAEYNKEDDRQLVKFYEGREGVKRIYKKILNCTSEIIWFGASEDFINEFPEFRNKIINTFIEKEKFPGFRSIYNNTKIYREHRNMRNKNKKLNSERRLLTDDLIFSNCVSVIYDNKVLIISLGNDIFAVLFDNKTITDMFKCIFELAWQAAEKIR